VIIDVVAAGIRLILLEKRIGAAWHAAIVGGRRASPKPFSACHEDEAKP